ncbi:hypothetical protein H0H87_002291 [Tephrocybe sp. NHM501043]|nr:hypothetical protein H0H87_002291 [Tephrocybe sp. NHM501043]
MLSIHTTKSSSFISNIVALAKRKKEPPAVKVVPGIFVLRKSKKEAPPENIKLTDEMSEKITEPLHRAKREIRAALIRLEDYMKFMYDGEFGTCMSDCKLTLNSILSDLEAQNARKYSTITSAKYKELLVAAEAQSLASERVLSNVTSLSIGAKRRAQQNQGLTPAEAGSNANARLQRIHETEAKASTS